MLPSSNASEFRPSQPHTLNKGLSSIQDSYHRQRRTDTMVPAGEPKILRFQDLQFQIEDVPEPCSAIVSNAKPLRRGKREEWAPSGGLAKSSKPSVESSVVQLIKSTHEINPNRIRKGKTIMNKHSKPAITRQSSLTANLHRGSSRQIKNVRGAVREVHSPISSCRSSPAKLQSK